MIIKTGVDIIEVDRIQEAIESQREAKNMEETRGKER